MVHLSVVENDARVGKPPVEEIKHLEIFKPEENEVSETVYGSRFAAEGLPCADIPSGQMYVTGLEISPSRTLAET